MTNYFQEFDDIRKEIKAWGKELEKEHQEKLREKEFWESDKFWISSVCPKLEIEI